MKITVSYKQINCIISECMTLHMIFIAIIQLKLFLLLFLQTYNVQCKRFIRIMAWI